MIDNQMFVALMKAHGNSFVTDYGAGGLINRRKRQDGDFAVEPGLLWTEWEAALVEVLDRFGLDEHNSHPITGICHIISLDPNVSRFAQLARRSFADCRWTRANLTGDGGVWVVLSLGAVAGEERNQKSTGWLQCPSAAGDCIRIPWGLWLFNRNAVNWRLIHRRVFAIQAADAPRLSWYGLQLLLPYSLRYTHSLFGNHYGNLAASLMGAITWFLGPS